MSRSPGFILNPKDPGISRPLKIKLILFFLSFDIIVAFMLSLALCTAIFSVMFGFTRNVCRLRLRLTWFLFFICTASSCHLSISGDARAVAANATQNITAFLARYRSFDTFWEYCQATDDMLTDGIHQSNWLSVYLSRIQKIAIQRCGIRVWSHLVYYNRCIFALNAVGGTPSMDSQVE